MKITSEKNTTSMSSLKLETLVEHPNGMKELAGKTGVWDLRLISLPSVSISFFLG